MSNYNLIGDARRAELRREADAARRGAGFEVARPVARPRLGAVALLLIAALASVAFVTAPVAGAATTDAAGGAGRLLAK